MGLRKSVEKVKCWTNGWNDLCGEGGKVNMPMLQHDSFLVFLFHTNPKRMPAVLKRRKSLSLLGLRFCLGRGPGRNITISSTPLKSNQQVGVKLSRFLWQSGRLAEFLTWGHFLPSSMAPSRNKKDWLVVTNEPQGVLSCILELVPLLPPPLYLPLTLFVPSLIPLGHHCHCQYIKWLCKIMLCKRAIYISCQQFCKIFRPQIFLVHHQAACPLQLPQFPRFEKMPLID